MGQGALMLNKIAALLLGWELVRPGDPRRVFHSPHYLRHNARRLEHLASLGIPVKGMHVLEVGAGIGDHSHFFLDRGCPMTITEARPELIARLRKLYPGLDVRLLDMESPHALDGAPFDIVYCYGLLYHLSRPAEALAYLARNARRMLLLETCVSFGDALEIHPTPERAWDPSQAVSGTGCRPTRAWLFRELKGLFEHVYVPKTQPCHEEFPLDWSSPAAHRANLQRAIFVCSRAPLANDKLSPSLLELQTRED